MKLLVLSDLHLEFHPLKINSIPDCDAILLAGDIGVRDQGFMWAETELRKFGVPVLYIPGNHEYYSRATSLQQLNHQLSNRTSFVEFVHNRAREFPEHNTVIISATLWTDYKVHGNQHMNLQLAKSMVNDYRTSNYEFDVPLTPTHCLKENQISTTFIQEKMAEYKEAGWKTVVMTHHAPTEQSCSEFYFGKLENVCFVNTFDRDYDFIWPDYWVHGHVHNPVDHKIGDCRVVANPRGYVRNTSGEENPDFNPDFILEV